jgi:hypothetical protein
MQHSPFPALMLYPPFLPPFVQSPFPPLRNIYLFPPCCNTAPCNIDLSLLLLSHISPFLSHLRLDVSDTPVGRVVGAAPHLTIHLSRADHKKLFTSQSLQLPPGSLQGQSAPRCWSLYRQSARPPRPSAVIQTDPPHPPRDAMPLPLCPCLVGVLQTISASPSFSVGQLYRQSGMPRPLLRDVVSSDKPVGYQP